MTLAQVDASSYTTDARAKTMLEFGKQDTEKAREYYILIKD